jgi:chemotaxis family two-component system response regulator Rcp1
MICDQVQQLSLLLVEDSPADVFVKEAMRQEGLSFQMEVADDGETAIRILDRVDIESSGEHPNLVLLDVNIPRRDGTQVLQRLRQSPRCGKIPVVMISSSDSPADRKRAIDMGATEYFRKPSNLEEFMQLGRLVRRLHEAESRGADGHVGGPAF